MDKLIHLMVVDDDADIRNLLGQFLSQHNYEVSLASNGEEMFQKLTDKIPDLIILDIMLPGDDGFELCRKLRSSHSMPIIMLTAVDEEADRIVGLELGADDYLTKPFNPRELLARIKAILRRTAQPIENAADAGNDILGGAYLYRFADWRLDIAMRRLLSSDDMEIVLSAGEFDLLVALVEHPNRILSRDQLLDITRNRPAGPFDRSIDVQISRLRHKIEEDPKHPALIKTVRGGGYMLAAKVERIKS